MSLPDSSGQSGSPTRRQEPEVDPGVALDRFVPGIYNYCDRWCKRCPATAQCYLSWYHTLIPAEDRVIRLLADLDWMRRQIEETFPGLRSFKRPGLDGREPREDDGWPRP